MPSGQASTDYVAMLLVVAVVLVGAFAWADGHALADGVQHAFARALCVARAGDCDVDALPCVTASDATRTEATLKLGFIRLDQRTALLRQERSDGTVLITRGVLAGGGPVGGVGVSGDLAVRGLQLGAGASAEVSAAAVFERSRGWIVHGRAAADRLVALLGRRGGPGERAPVLPPPDITTDRRGLHGSIDASAAFGPLTAALGVAGDSVQEQRLDRTTGRRTVVLERSAEGAVSLTAAGVGALADVGATERYGVTLDREGRPLDLVVWRQGELQRSASLPRRLQIVAGLLGTSTRGGRVWVEETHLDLTEAENLTLARAFLTQAGDRSLRPLAERVAIARALAQRLDAVGVEHVRTMAVRESRLGASGTVGVGLRFGGGLERATIHQRILDAVTRGIDGVWRRRADCTGQA